MALFGSLLCIPYFPEQLSVNTFHPCHAFRDEVDHSIQVRLSLLDFASCSALWPDKVFCIKTRTGAVQDSRRADATWGMRPWHRQISVPSLCLEKLGAAGDTSCPACTSMLTVQTSLRLRQNGSCRQRLRSFLCNSRLVRSKPPSLRKLIRRACAARKRDPGMKEKWHVSERERQTRVMKTVAGQPSKI